MKQLNKYKLNKNVTDKLLFEHGFRNNQYQCYVYKDLIKLVIHVDIEERWWSYSIIDDSTNNLYPAYYNTEYGKNEIVAVIDYKITKVLNKMVDNHILSMKKVKKREKTK